jgi:penicillin-binding protein 1A
MSRTNLREEAAHGRRATRAFRRVLMQERAQLRREGHPGVSARAAAEAPYAFGAAPGPWGPRTARPVRGRAGRLAFDAALMAGWAPLRVAAMVSGTTLVFGLFAVGAIAIGANYAQSALTAAEAAAPSGHTFLSRDGRPLGTRGETAAAPVRLDELPKPVVQSLLAIEDNRYQQRWLPIDLRGSLRAAWVNLRCRCTAQGGSTIAQQLAKQLLHNASPTFGRKLKEALVATYLQLHLGKQKVLEDYLSSAPYGHGYIGLRAAARGYFGKDPDQLSLSEAAELAGLLRAPSKLNPVADPTASWARAQLVLRRMVDAGYITPVEAAAASQPRLAFQQPDPGRGYLIDMLEAELRGSGATGRAGRYMTTIDMDMQTAAEEAVTASLPLATALGAHQAALVAMRPDGTIVALVGGRDYSVSKFNRATQARRPIGSEAKIAIYAAALDAGFRPDDSIDDAPVRIGGWAPRNFDGTYEGRITVRQAFARSRNAATVRLALRVGLGRVIAVARRAGVSGPLDPAQPSFLLGSTAISPLQMAGVFSGLTHCAPVAPHVFVTDRDAHQACTPILDTQNHSELADLLHSVLTSGTGRAASFPGDQACGGKTGTTSDSRDAWFAGACNNLVVVVWTGNDDDSPTRTEGGALSAKIWRSFMVHAAHAYDDTSR